MHIGTPLTHGNGRNAQLPCQPFTRLLVLNKNHFNSIKRSFAHLYLIKTECKYNKIQFLHQRIIEKMVLNGGKLSFFAQIQYYWRISQSYFYVNLYRKEVCYSDESQYPYEGFCGSLSHLCQGKGGFPIYPNCYNVWTESVKTIPTDFLLSRHSCSGPVQHRCP